MLWDFRCRYPHDRRIISPLLAAKQYLDISNILNQAQQDIVIPDDTMGGIPGSGKKYWIVCYLRYLHPNKFVSVWNLTLDTIKLYTLRPPYRPIAWSFIARSSAPSNMTIPNAGIIGQIINPQNMMASSNGNITGHLCGEFTGRQWRGALMFSLIWAWIHGWVNNRKACYLRRHRAHYDISGIWR